MRINSFSSNYYAKPNQAFGMKFEQSPEMEYFVKESINGHGSASTQGFMRQLSNFLPNDYSLIIKMVRPHKFHVIVEQDHKECLWSEENVRHDDPATSEDVLKMLAGQTDNISRETIVEEIEAKKRANAEPIIDAEIVEDAPPLKTREFSNDAIIPEIMPEDKTLKPLEVLKPEIIIDAEIVD